MQQKKSETKENVLDKTNQKHLKHAYAYPIVCVCVFVVFLYPSKQKQNNTKYKHCIKFQFFCLLI